MTSIRLVELARIAMRGVPHVDVEATIAGFRYYSQREREDAGKVYAAIIGEKVAAGSEEEVDAGLSGLEVKEI